MLVNNWRTLHVPICPSTTESCNIQTKCVFPCILSSDQRNFLFLMPCLLDSPLCSPLFVTHNSYFAIFLYSAKYKYSAKYTYIFLQHPAFLETEYIIIPQNTYFQLFFPQNTDLARFFFRKIQDLSNKFRKLRLSQSTRKILNVPQTTEKEFP